MTEKLARYTRMIPGPVEVVFLTVLGMLLFSGPYVLLNDPGTPWHLRLGREILAAHDVPRFDTLTFTKGHASWVDQSWGFDVMLAALSTPGAGPPRSG